MSSGSQRALAVPTTSAAFTKALVVAASSSNNSNSSADHEHGTMLTPTPMLPLLDHPLWNQLHAVAPSSTSSSSSLFGARPGHLVHRGGGGTSATFSSDLTPALLTASTKSILYALLPATSTAATTTTSHASSGTSAASSSTLACVDLQAMRHAATSSSSDTSSSLVSIRVEPALPHDASHLSVNGKGSLLVVASSLALHIVKLPSATAFAVAKSEHSAALICRSYRVGTYFFGLRASIVQVAWHPASDHHVVVLSTDHHLRIFNVRHNLDVPEHEFDLSAFSSSSGAAAQSSSSSSSTSALSSTFASTAFSSTTTAALHRRCTSFAFGPPVGWTTFAIFVLFSNGQISVICPVALAGCLYPASLINDLVRANRAPSSATAIEGEIDRAQRQCRLAWLTSTFRVPPNGVCSGELVAATAGVSSSSSSSSSSAAAAMTGASRSNTSAGASSPAPITAPQIPSFCGDADPCLSSASSSGSTSTTTTKDNHHAPRSSSADEEASALVHLDHIHASPFFLRVLTSGRLDVLVLLGEPIEPVFASVAFASRARTVFMPIEPIVLPLRAPCVNVRIVPNALVSPTLVLYTTPRPDTLHGREPEFFALSLPWLVRFADAMSDLAQASSVGAAAAASTASAASAASSLLPAALSSQRRDDLFSILQHTDTSVQRIATPLSGAVLGAQAVSDPLVVSSGTLLFAYDNARKHVALEVPHRSLHRVANALHSVWEDLARDREQRANARSDGTALATTSMTSTSTTSTTTTTSATNEELAQLRVKMGFEPLAPRIAAFQRKYADARLSLDTYRALAAKHGANGVQTIEELQAVWLRFKQSCHDLVLAQSELTAHSSMLDTAFSVQREMLSRVRRAYADLDSNQHALAERLDAHAELQRNLTDALYLVQRDLASRLDLSDAEHAMVRDLADKEHELVKMRVRQDELQARAQRLSQLVTRSHLTQGELERLKWSLAAQSRSLVELVQRIDVVQQDHEQRRQQ